jgi:hypothetical protein
MLPIKILGVTVFVLLVAFNSKIRGKGFVKEVVNMNW